MTLDEVYKKGLFGHLEHVFVQIFTCVNHLELIFMYLVITSFLHLVKWISMTDVESVTWVQNLDWAVSFPLEKAWTHLFILNMMLNDKVDWIL